MKRSIAVLVAFIVALSTFGVAPAFATQPNTTPCVPAEAYTETVIDKEAWDEKVIDSEAVPAVPGTDAVYKTQYQFEHAPNGVYKIKWEDDPNWNAESNPNSTGWRSTGETRQKLVTPAVDGTPAVDEVSHIVKHEAVTHTVDHPAVVCDEVPPRPEDKKWKFKEVNDPDCEAGTVETVITIVKRTWTYDEELNKWLPVDTHKTRSKFRDATEEECPPNEDKEVVAPAPTFTDPTCEKNLKDFHTVETEGIVWNVDDSHDDNKLTLTITAEAEEGYVIDGQSVWSHTYPDFKTEEQCDDEDDETPPVKQVAQTVLPDTGGAQLGLLAAGLVLLASGVLILRRRA